MNQDFHKVFDRILGKPCWGVKPGHGSFITLEFGRPHLEVREPIAARRGVSARVNEHLASRGIYIHGESRLSIRCCNWEVDCKGKRVGDSSNGTKIRRAADFLDGQKLIRLSILPRKVQSIFVFDLGATLKTIPYDESSEQWMIFNPSNKALILRADGRYTCIRSDLPISEGVWKKVRPVILRSSTRF